MKMKKLLAIGALSLALTCSTSIGAFAAERPTNEQIKTDMVKLFLADKSPLTYDIKADTIVGNVVNVKNLQNDLITYGFGGYADDFPGETYDTLNEALGLIESDKTVIYNAKKIAVVLSKEGKFDDLLTEVRSIATVLRDIENSADKYPVDEEIKLNIENDIRNLVKGSNESLDVFFGKNANGEATMSIVQGNQIILQLSSKNAYTISDSLKNDADKLKAYAELFNFIY